jgi:hypothetical protein
VCEYCIATIYKLLMILYLFVIVLAVNVSALSSSRSAPARSDLLSSSLEAIELDDDLYFLAALVVLVVLVVVGVALVRFGLDLRDFREAVALEVLSNSDGSRGGLTESVDLNLLEFFEDRVRAASGRAGRALRGDSEDLVFRVPLRALVVSTLSVLLSTSVLVSVRHC